MFTIPTEFREPQKVIINDKSLFNQFKFSKAYFYVSNFVDQANTLVKSKSYTDAPPCSESVQQIIDILTQVQQVFKETPPVARDCRYGNPSFKKFIEKLTDKFEQLHEKIIPEEYKPALIEIKAYFMDMFGSYGRLDYGTGHELNFICYIVCLLRLQLIGTIDDILNVILKVFQQYIQIVLDIQNIYTLEPAGSHGAWSVDDYNLLPFVFGSAQLIDQNIQVNTIFTKEKVQQLKDDNMYMRMMDNIYEVKSFELTTNSPFISELHMRPEMTWAKLNTGMLKHWHTEVLGKWPVIQHFWFGNLLGFQ